MHLLGPGGYEDSQAVPSLQVMTRSFPSRPGSVLPPSQCQDLAACVSHIASFVLGSPIGPLPCSVVLGVGGERQGSPQLLRPSGPCGEPQLAHGAHGAVGVGGRWPSMCCRGPQTHPHGGSKRCTDAGGPAGLGPSRVLQRQAHWPWPSCCEGSGWVHSFLTC